MRASTIIRKTRVLRLWYGPFPIEFCHFCLLLKGTIIYATPCQIAGIVILKFFYICIWKRFRQIDDDFVAKMITIFAFYMGFLMSLTKILAPGKPTFNTIYCTGLYISSFDQMNKKFPIGNTPSSVHFVSY